MKGRRYRDDVDGVRAIAVLSTILFHFGRLPNGYLGVDVFFVISGYLITGIIYDELLHDRFSLARFYLRRTRRIIPLALFISIVTLAVGMLTMLPDDLENVAESVVATNCFANNVLQAITVGDYWHVINEYKPLLHTWSLGIEEQYYFVYPLMLLLLGKRLRSLLPPVLGVLTVASLALNFAPFPDHQKFYYIPFRFYELSAGGLGAVYFKDRLLRHPFSPLLLLALVGVLCAPLPFVPVRLLVLATVVLTLGVLVSANETSAITTFALENRVMVGVGKLSFSMYMWHQVLLAYTRYALFPVLQPLHLAAIFVLTVLLSLATYRWVEQPFRRKERVSTRALLITVSTAFTASTAFAFLLYLRAGVWRDVPELDITADRAQRGMHSAYNDRVYAYDTGFKPTDKLKVLVIGNSYGRDWVNLLLESRYRDDIAISYVDAITRPDLASRMKEADVVFYADFNGVRPSEVPEVDGAMAKIWVVGTKNFGASNGVFYNHRGGDYYAQRTPMEKGYVERNEALAHEWGGRFIDLIGKVVDDKGTVPVFTPSHKLISHDGRHFTRAGAEYFAELVDAELSPILRRPAP